MRFLFAFFLFLCGSALGFYLGRPVDRRPPPDGYLTEWSDAEGTPIDAAEAWRNYFEAREEARRFVDDPKPHPFFVAAAFAVVGIGILGLGSLANESRRTTPDRFSGA